MNELNEKLSVVLDEYADDQKSQSVLNEVIGDVNLQYQMRRYQLIGEVLRHELPDRLSLDLSRHIMSKIQQSEVTPEASPTALDSSGQKSSFWHWANLKPLAGFAVAATVAVVSVTLWQAVSVNPQGDQSGEQLVSIEQQKIEKLVSQPLQVNAVPVSTNTALSMDEGTRWSAFKDSPALQQKLNAYLVNHTEYSSPMQGLIPQARVAGYDAQQ